MTEKQKISIIGAGGLVGKELSLLLKDARRFARKEGQDELGTIESMDRFDPKDFELLFLCTPSEISKEIASKHSSICKMIDLSSAFRNHPSVPLIIPEINPLDLYQQSRIIASPNCTTTILLMALYPLHKIWKLKSCRVTTFQAASGGGKKMLEQLLLDTKHAIEQPNLNQKNVAFSSYPHESNKNDVGYCAEELKMIEESQKILKSDFILRPFCTRVPTKRVHSLAIDATFEEKIDPIHAIWALNNMPGVCYSSEASSQIAEKQSEVFCANLRADLYDDKTLNLWAFGDQLLKGAALNALQIMQLLEKQIVQKL